MRLRPDTAPEASFRQVEVVDRPVKPRRGNEKKNGPDEYAGAVPFTREIGSSGVAALARHALLQIAAVDQVGLGLAIDHCVIHDHLAHVLQRG